MSPRTSTSSYVTRVAAVLCLSAALVVTSGSSASGDGRSVEGAWLVQVTPRNCETNAPLGSFSSLVTFARGGTLSESPGGLAFAPGQRSAGHGAWSRESGHTYTQRMVALILYATPPNPPMSPGFEAGWQTVTHTFELSDADHFTSAGFSHFFRANGELYRTGCSTATGERFQ
jgi:hypothetical protein